MNSPYAYDASMPSAPDPSSPDYDEYQKRQRQKLVTDALTAQLAQPQGAQQSVHPMAASGGALGALQPLADAYINATLRQRQQQALQARTQGAGIFSSSDLPSGLDYAGGPAYG